MCLLIVGKSTTIRQQLLQTPGLIEDIYGHNEDGLGVMFVTAKQQVKVAKRLPKGAQGFREMIAAMPNDDRPVAVHARMKTHGDIDLENCHPYQINDASWLMHNGILHTGNAADRSKSDTFHFINDYLSELTPDALHAPGMVKMLGDFIDNNRFAIMSADGRLSVVNREQGIEHDGVWYSNTYAWEPSLLIPGYRTKSFTGYGRRWGGHLADLDDDERYGGYRSGGAAWAAAYEVDDEPDAMTEFELGVHQTLMDYDVSTLGAMLDDPELRGETIDYILTNYEITPYHMKGRDSIEAEDVSDRVRTAARAWRDYKDDTLDGLARTTPHSVAEALLYYCDFVHVDDPDRGQDEQPATNGNVIELGNGFRVEMPAEVM